MLFLKKFRSWRGRRRWKAVSEYYNDPLVKNIEILDKYGITTLRPPWLPEKTKGTNIYNDLRKILKRLNLMEEL